jgi:hypothetical protein
MWAVSENFLNCNRNKKRKEENEKRTDSAESLIISQKTAMG